MNAELISALRDFLDDFELVFDHDWEHSLGCLRDEWIHFFISPQGTFLNPKVPDESNDWGNRGCLLATYRRAKDALALLDAAMPTERKI